MEVGNERVKLFENSNSGVIVVTDDMLENSISIEVKTSSTVLSATDEAAASKRAKKAVAAAVKRAKVITIEFSFKAQGYPRFHGWKEDELRASCQSPTPGDHYETTMISFVFNSSKLTAGNFKHWMPFFQNSKKKKVEPKSAGL